jgi:hypothetical protein
MGKENKAGVTVEEAMRAHGPREFVAKDEELLKAAREFPRVPRAWGLAGVSRERSGAWHAQFERDKERYDVRVRIFQHVCNLAAAGVLIVTHQPLTPPTAERETIPAARCAALRLTTKGKVEAAWIWTERF